MLIQKNNLQINVDQVLLATGRRANIEGLNLEAAKINYEPVRGIQVDDRLRTTNCRIYAAGDVIGFPALASTAMEQARIAMVHAFDLKYKTELATILPYGIYTIPECSMAGKTEEDLVKEKVSYVVGRAHYNSNARGQIIGDELGFLKLIFSKKDMKLSLIHI